MKMLEARSQESEARRGARFREMLQRINKKQGVSLTILLGLCICFLLACQSDQKHLIIGIQQLGEIKKENIDIVSSAIQAEYGSAVVVLAPRKIPEGFMVRKARYRADSIIHFLRKIKPDSIHLVIGLTNADISVTKRDHMGKIKEPQARYADWGVFGYGYQPGTGCVISTFRIKGDATLSRERLKKIALHEVGHNLGLAHCTNIRCCMVDAVESINSVDKTEDHLCNQCKRKISAELD